MLMDRVKLATMRKWILLIVIFTAADQISKQMAQATLNFAEPVPVSPFLNFMLVYNTGAAFSFLSDAGGWQRWFFIALAASVCLYILYWLRSLKDEQPILGLGLCLILGGALGNLIDRILFGKVIDFIDIFYPAQNECLPLFFRLPGSGCHWPTFNVADILITIGAGILLLQLLREAHTAHESN